MNYRTSENFTAGDAAEILIRAHDGDCALLYIWKTYRNSSDAEGAARDLCMTLMQVQAAEEKLQRMGLSGPSDVPLSSVLPAAVPGGAPAMSLSAPALSPSAPALSPSAPATAGMKPVKGASAGSAVNTVPQARPLPAEELPEYTSEAITKAGAEDPAFSALQMQLQNITGRIPNRNDLSRLLGIYHHLGLPAEVIYVLLTYCLECSKASTGTPPTINFIERQAFIWVNRGIATVEDAENYAEQQKNLRSDKNRIKTVLEIYDRKLTSNEEKYIESWLELGFEDEAIRVAYERTIEKTGSRSIPYMNRILQSWHSSGIHTVREIEEKDPGKRGRPKKRAGAEPAAFDPGALDNIIITKD